MEMGLYMRSIFLLNLFLYLHSNNKNAMKNFYFVFILLTGFFFFKSSTVNAQTEQAKSSLMITAGIGDATYAKSLGDFSKDNFDNVNLTSALPTFFFRTEFKNKKMSGFMLTTQFNELNYVLKNSYVLAEHYTESIYHVKEDFVQTGFRYNEYLVSRSKFDLYVGFGVGVKSHWYTGDAYAIQKMKPVISVGGQVCFGGHFYISNHFGIYGEVGIGNSVGNGGLVYRF
jgi:hypothetical protein